MPYHRVRLVGPPENENLHLGVVQSNTIFDQGNTAQFLLAPSPPLEPLRGAEQTSLKYPGCVLIDAMT